ncbi:MAG: peptidoglycan editing factor PgeF [Spiribacter sp.]|nr:peptidoglycan editing factor PgeF [Spiribacter sp.]
MGECIQILRPDWTISGVNAGFTQRTGGVSHAPYESLNLALHVGDHPDHVHENRQRLVDAAALPEEPRWLKQVHGARVVHASDVERDVTEADAVWTDQPGEVCAVLVADCVPILLAANEGRCVAAIHAGWRGLAAGVIEATIEALPVAADGLSAVIGPCIGKDAYEVGPEVIEALDQAMPVPPQFRQSEASQESRLTERDAFWLDMAASAEAVLRYAGVPTPRLLGHCTHTEANQYYSYRRDGVSGRIAGFIALSG